MSFWGTWSLLTCLMGICNLVLSYKQKKRRFFLTSLLLLCVGTTGLQMVRNTFDGDPFPIHEGWRLGILFGCLAVAIWTTYHNLRWNQTHVTPLSIQESFEKLTEGVLFYRDGGQCVLVNGRMQEISRELMGHILLNGEEFAETVFAAKLDKETDKILTLKDGSVKEFFGRRVVFEKEEIWEVVAADITELFEKTKQLQEENQRLQEFQKRLLKYHEEIMDTVRMEEILQAKMSIHDEMNRLLLTTRRAVISKDAEERRKAVLAWKSNALLLCREAQAKSNIEEALKDLTVVATAMGIEMVMEETPSFREERTLELFVLATREAMVNAVKHADAKKMNVRILGEASFWTIVYENDGAVPKGPIHETGGLRNLHQKLEGLGGSMETMVAPMFRLTVHIPIKEV
ncbi:MAG: hypothetical protein E7295_17190 [Lachnospiraceae bacterium]|nr:hypothetical protein [Lachnospiraceae bacterium]